MEIKKAAKADARDLACLVNLAGEGMPEYLWANLAGEGESPLDVGEKRAARDAGNFSYNNARVCVQDDALQGMILAYRLPDPCEIADIADYPGPVRPLLALEARVPGTWYINAIATCEAYRGQGVAKKLMADTEAQAQAFACEKMSLIVAEENVTAKKLYEYLGFTIAYSLPVVTYPGCPRGGCWLLMIKPVS